MYVGLPSGTQTLITGKVKHMIYKCETIPDTQVTNYMILPYSMFGSQRAAYFFDLDVQRFSNPLDIMKEPVAYLGASEAVESAADPKRANWVFSVSNGEFFTIGDVDYDWGADWVIRPATHFLRLKILALPPPGEKELIYTFYSDKELPIYITHDSRFVVGTGAQSFTTKVYTIPTGVFLFFKIVYTRMKYTERYYDCSVEIEVYGVDRDGGDLKCKN